MAAAARRTLAAPASAVLVVAVLLFVATALGAPPTDAADAPAAVAWAACGGLNGPNRADALGASCQQGFSCVRQDRVRGH